MAARSARVACGREGDERARDELIAVVQPQLRQIAARYLQRERADHTLEANAPVNELWMRLMGAEPIAFNDRAHFFAVAAADDAPHPHRPRAGAGDRETGR